MMRLSVLISSMFLFVYSSFAQVVKCPFNEVNCSGKCGLFNDTNVDAFCDHSTLVCVTQAKIDSISQKKAVENTTTKKSSETNTPQKNDSVLVKASMDIETQDSTKTSMINDQPCSNKKPYHPIPILLSLIGLYIGTYILVKSKLIKMQTHRKIWNIGLTLTFIVSGLLGLVLVFFIQYAYIPSYYLDFMALHVDFGVAMAIISLFHALWHLKYYKNILKKNK